MKKAITRRWDDRTASRRLANIIDFARALANEDPAALVDLVRIIGRRIQYEHIALICGHDYRSYEKREREERDVPRLNAHLTLMSEFTEVAPGGTTLRSLMRQIPGGVDIDLRHDLIFPWPWKRERLVSALVNIGEHCRSGRWTQHPQNHSATYWGPVGIAWVEGGNHSIAAGIVKGEGLLHVEKAFDISAVYDHVICDGVHYRRVADNSIIGLSGHAGFAALFEIGRVMHEHGISSHRGLGDEAEETTRHRRSGRLSHYTLLFSGLGGKTNHLHATLMKSGEATPEEAMSGGVNEVLTHITKYVSQNISRENLTIRITPTVPLQTASEVAALVVRYGRIDDKDVARIMRQIRQ